MTDQDENSNSAGSFNAVSDIGKILARALLKKPVLAAVVLVMLIAALVIIAAIVSNLKEAFYSIVAFLILALVIAILLIRMEIREQKETIRSSIGDKLSMGNDTTSIIGLLNTDQCQDIINILSGAAKDVADALGIPIELVRSNLFGVVSDGTMRMLKNFTFNMNREEELTISMPVGYGSTGRCFKNRKPNIAIFREGWGENVIEGEELSKVHPDLQWIISVPVPPGGEKSPPIWVLNVDGLKERFGEEKLREALRPLFYWSQMIYSVVKESRSNQGGEI
ncbi:MAG: hypothetical protein ACLPYB_12590 [Desulfobaccales bacterium]